MIDVLYFASLREKLGTDQEQVDGSFDTVQALMDQLCERGDDWRTELRDNAQLQIAVNQSIASRETSLNEGDEVAFFPPVTGG